MENFAGMTGNPTFFTFYGFIKIQIAKELTPALSAFSAVNDFWASAGKGEG